LHSAAVVVAAVLVAVLVDVVAVVFIDVVVLAVVFGTFCGFFFAHFCGCFLFALVFLESWSRGCHSRLWHDTSRVSIFFVILSSLFQRLLGLFYITTALTKGFRSFQSGKGTHRKLL